MKTWICSWRCIALFLLTTASSQAIPFNLTPLGSANASSELIYYSPPGYATNANDGNRDGDYYNGSVFMSESPAPDPDLIYWEVNLGAMYYLDHIRLFPINWDDSVYDFRIRVFDNYTNEVFSHTYLTDYPAYYAWGTTAIRGLRGQIVQIEKSASWTDWLSLAEFEVWGQATPSPTNLALNKPVTYSSIYTNDPYAPPTQPGSGNDGDIDGDYFHQALPVFHSGNYAAGEFWQVDLQTTNAIDYLMYWNRQDYQEGVAVKLQVLNGNLQAVYTATQDIRASMNEFGAYRYGILHDIPGVVTGRYVRVETVIADYLAFSEVEVFGMPPATPAAPDLIFGMDTNWRWRQGTSEASSPDTTAWRQTNFNESAWSNSPAPLMYTFSPPEPPFWNGGVFTGTTLSDMPGNYQCVFMRKSFVFTNSARILSLTLTAASDDGFIAWFNGVEIARRNMPAGNIAYNGNALGRVTEPQPLVAFTFTNVGGLVLTGTNILAVQAFNADFGSSDFAYMASLRATYDTNPPIIQTLSPASGALVSILTNVDITFSEAVTGLNASDLLINNIAATNMVSLGGNTYRFLFAQPNTIGDVIITWATAHGITDLAVNPFSATSWFYRLDPPRALISEFLTDNKGGLEDQFGSSPDWIELYNPGTFSVNLDGWYLSDNAGNLTKWRIPAVVLAPNTYIIVFASGTSRTVLTEPLHTNFKLSNNGGFVGLTKPDGVTVASSFNYGAQSENVSYGTGRITSLNLVSSGAVARYFVPSNNSLGLLWTGGNEPFSDAGWSAGSIGVGYDQAADGAGLLGWWNFNDATNLALAPDVSGHGHVGAIVSPAAFSTNFSGRTGLSGDRAMGFNGGGGIVKINDATNGMFNTASSNGALTVSLWINGSPSQPAACSAFWASEIADGSGTRVAQAHVPWADSVIYWDTGPSAGGGWERIQVGEPVTSKWRGQWNHYVFVKDKGLQSIWQNGALIANDPEGTPTLSTIRGFGIGGIVNGTFSYSGLIDDFAVWDTGLGAAQIQYLASGGTPTKARKLTPLIATDVGSAMFGKNASIYLRMPFVVTNTADFTYLTLRMRYDDGFVAYLNGVEIARRLAPAVIAFDSAATAKRSSGAAFVADEMDVSPYVRMLRTGTNILSVQAFNSSSNDIEFVSFPELIGSRSNGNRFFVDSTPGAANTAGVAGLIANPAFSPGRGFYGISTNVIISESTANATLIYTLDGSEPSVTNGVVVTNGSVTVQVTNTASLRAVAFRSDYQPSKMVTHTYLFPSQVVAQQRPSGVPSTWTDGVSNDFQIDLRVVTNAQTGYSFTNALVQLPSLSIVSPKDGLFSSIKGIYANSQAHGDQWERMASLELMYPDGRAGFQENTGLRVHGGVSRANSFTPKHGFTFFFRSEYGTKNLDFSWFSDTTVHKFNHLVARACSTDSWPVDEWAQYVDGVLRWKRAEASYQRDQWVRNAQIAMGQESSHGTYVHLYLNGLYWGIYNICERTDADFASSHFGGEDEDYDVLADFAEVHAGTKDAWNQLISLSGADLSNNTNYQRLLGRNADGTLNTNYPVLLDVTNLVDYMILHVFIGADDWPNHNWWAARRRDTNSTGFKFFAWDQEISNNSLIKQHSSWGPLYAEANAYDTPAYVYSRCRLNAEFRQMFGDRVQRHMFNSGALSVSNNIARWDARVAELDFAIVAESARWGDYQRPSQPFLREVEWVNSNNWVRTVYFPSNHFIALKRFQDANLSPLVKAPVFRQHGGIVAPGWSLYITNMNATGTIYYTINGGDPRLPGGTVDTNATAYSGPVSISAVSLVRARVKDGSTWSALTEATFTPGAGLAPIKPRGYVALDVAPSQGPGGSGEVAVNGGASLFLQVEHLQTTEAGNDVVVSFDGSANRTYRLESTTSLQLPDWKPLATETIGTVGKRVTLTNSVSAPARFYRVVVVQ